MKVNHNWLQEWLELPSSLEVAERLTMAGLEVDAVHPAAGEFSGVIVAHIVKAEPHPDADRLRICQLDTGKGEVQVVCGGKNARAGIKIAFAQVGSVLPGDFKLKKAKLRGVESFGMICSESELGLGEGEDHCIIELAADAPIGQDLRDYLQLDDAIYDIELTPNRGDCTSVQGLARDLAAITEVSLAQPEVQLQSESSDLEKAINLAAPERCPQYLGRAISGVNLAVATPLWLAERLRRAGLRSINFVVDVTNYVMLELGQPMHAFDYEQVVGDIQVRLAKAGEKLQLLDEQDIELTTSDLVIADAEKPLALAGIMGGKASGVTEGSSTILLESAYFTPAPIMLSARHHKLASDSSYRFERGVDYQLQRKAIERASELIVTHAGGHLGPVVSAISSEHMPAPIEITLHYHNITRLLGISINQSFARQALVRLGMQVQELDDASCLVTVASHRPDITLEADLIEEIARLYGYNNIPSHAGKMTVVMPDISETTVTDQVIAETLKQRGFNQAMTYSFISQKAQDYFYPNVQSLALANPMAEDMAVMRAGLLPGLVNACAYNNKRQQDHIQLFELGTVFELTDHGKREQHHLAMAVCSANLGFFELKAEVNHLLAMLGVNPDWQATQQAGMHPGRTASLAVNGKVVAVCGQLHPGIAKELHISGEVYLCEINLDALAPAELTAYRAISKYPSVRRDIAIIVSKQVNYSNIHEVIANCAIELLQSIQLFDIYEGQGIEAGSHSLALGFTFQALDRTLVDDEVNAVMQKIVEALETHFNAQLRA